MMGLLDQLGGIGGGDPGAIAKKVDGLLESVGGVSGLVQKFDEKGLGDVAKSWVGSGENKAVSAEQVKEALGSEELEKIASASGSSVDGAANDLSALLPELVDKLSPDGEVPSAEAVKERLGKLLS